MPKTTFPLILVDIQRDFIRPKTPLAEVPRIEHFPELHPNLGPNHCSFEIDQWWLDHGSCETGTVPIKGLDLGLEFSESLSIISEQEAQGHVK